MKFPRSNLNSQVMKLNEETIHYLQKCHKYISFEQINLGCELQGSRSSLEGEAVRCHFMASTGKRQFLDANTRPVMFQNPVFISAYLCIAFQYTVNTSTNTRL